MFKNTFFLFLITLILSINYLICYGEETPPPDLNKTAMIMIKETYNLINQGGDKIWKDWSKTKFPILLIDQDHLFLVNFPQPPSDFLEYKEADPDLGKIYYKKGTLSPQIRASFLFNNQPVAAIGIQQSGFSVINWVGTLVQEMFHAYVISQPQTKDKIDLLKLATTQNQDWQSSYPFPYSDKVVGLLISQQYLRLRNCQNANEETITKLYDAYEIITIYKNYLKNSFKDIDAYAYAKYQEWMNGVGVYTEYKLLEFAASDEYKPTQAFADLEPYKNSGGYKNYFNIYSKTLKNKLNNYIFLPTDQLRQFFYLGSEKAFILDKVMPNWKNSFFDKEIWLDNLIEQNIKKIMDYKKKLFEPTRLYGGTPMALDEVLQAIGESCGVPVNFANGVKEKLHPIQYKPAFIDTSALQIFEFFVEGYGLTIKINEKGVLVEKIE